MVKFRGKPRKEKQEPRVAGETGVVQVYAPNKSGVSPSPKSPFKPFKFFGKLDRTGKLLLTGLIVLTGAVIFYGVVLQKSEPKSNLRGTADGWKFVAQEEADQLTLEQLKGNPPGNTATSREVTDYYAKLVTTNANLKDYKGAIDAFSDWESSGGKGITYFYLISVAGYYHEIDDDDSALVMLKRAENALPATDDPETGYYKSDALSWIGGLKKDYSK